jgi:hypothetical protein
MLVRLLADATVVVHLAFVLFVMLGGFIVVRWRRVAWVHLPAVAWAAWIQFADWICPLTPLENWLREQSGGKAYSSSFIEHYLLPVLYPESLSRELQWVLGGVVLLSNGVVYGVLAFRRHARK